MTDETYAIQVWYTDEDEYRIEADNPAEAAEKAHRRFIEIGEGTVDSIQVTGVEDGHSIKPLADPLYVSGQEL